MIDRPELIATINTQLRTKPHLGGMEVANVIVPTLPLDALGEILTPSNVSWVTGAGIGTSSVTTGDQLAGDYYIEITGSCHDAGGGGGARWTIDYGWINAIGVATARQSYEQISDSPIFQWRGRVHLFANWEFSCNLQASVAGQQRDVGIAWNRL